VEQRLQEGAPALLVIEEAWVTALHSLFETQSRAGCGLRGRRTPRCSS
jgi:hypothetical protein